MNAPRIAYDVFLSHNRADKPWVRTLAARLADTWYNGRRLRPWLDEHFLDPGSLSGEAELTTAIDRSRTLALVLSPEALASTWVDFELRYFARTRAGEGIIPILLRDCATPDALAGAAPVDFRADPTGEAELAELLARICPPSPVTPEAVAADVDAAFTRAVDDDPGGFGPGPSDARDGLLAAVVRHDIDDASVEGAAVAGFTRAAARLRALHDGRHPAAYNLKMLLGECLAVALARSVGYRQVAQRYLEMTAAEGGDPILLFVVARAYSKLAEFDPRRVDRSVLFRAVSQLDGIESGNEVRAIETLCARVLGKMRDAPGSELLIKALAERGRASRIVAAGAISLVNSPSSPVFYLSELERRHAERSAAVSPGAVAPSRRLLGELFALDIDQEPAVKQVVRTAREEVKETWPGIDLPYGVMWFLRELQPAGEGHLVPFTGTVLKVTTGEIVTQAGRADVSTVACLTEPRVVDALFDGCGALLIRAQEPDSPQCRRLRDRGIPFAMLGEVEMAALSDGDQVLAEAGGLRVMKG